MFLEIIKWNEYKFFRFILKLLGLFVVEKGGRWVFNFYDKRLFGD